MEDSMDLILSDEFEYLTSENIKYLKCDKSNRPKRKRHVLDPSSSLFDIATVLPNVGEMEWNPADNVHHSGKWPMEEEKFANRLVLEFEAGVLEDCKEGTTLRSYLAKTLRCAPMRVSKKFAGKCIGSKAFSRREGDRQSFLEKIRAGELTIATLQQRLQQKPSRKSNKTRQARMETMSEVSDDCSSTDPFAQSSSSSSSSDNETSSDPDMVDFDSLGHYANIRKQQTLVIRPYKRKEVNVNLNNVVGCGHANYKGLVCPSCQITMDSKNEESFVIPSLCEESDYGHYDDSHYDDSHAPVADVEEQKPVLHHITEQSGYGEWHDALSYFKESESFMGRTQSTLSLAMFLR